MFVFYTVKARLSSRFMKNQEKIKGEIFVFFLRKKNFT